MAASRLTTSAVQIAGLKALREGARARKARVPVQENPYSMTGSRGERLRALAWIKGWNRPGR